MRAYLSTGADRSERTADAGHYGDLGVAFRVDREARTILAAVEPWRKGGKDYNTWPSAWWMLPKDRAQDTGPERMAREIAAEALAAFVEG